MTWNLRRAQSAEKEHKRFPLRDQQRILATLQAMRINPFSGNIVRLKDQPSAWRRRVGSYRIFFDVYPDQILDVVAIRRRTSTTY